MRKIHVPKESAGKAIAILKRGGVVIFPTDTVYGFLADASNRKAVEKIFKIKKRPKAKPLSLFIKDIQMADEIAVISDSSMKFLKRLWPGNHTFVLKRKKAKLYGVRKGSIALRVPNYRPLNDILNEIKRPLVQTSVNISGTKPLSSINDIVAEFGDDDRVSLIVSGGNLRRHRPSKIIDLSTSKSKVIRA